MDYRALSDRLKLAREIAARTKPRFIEIPREKRVPFTEDQLNAIRGGLTAEEYRWKLIRYLVRGKQNIAMENDEDEALSNGQAKYEFKVHTPRRMPPVPVYSIYLKPLGRDILKGHVWLQMKPGPKEKAEELARAMQENIFRAEF